MDSMTVADLVDEVDDLVGWMRANGAHYEDLVYTSVPYEETNWLDEQRALHERVAISDLAALIALRISGPEAVDLLSDLAVNDVASLPVGRATQLVMCSPDGYVMGDGPMLRLGEETFGGPAGGAIDWIRYHLETGDYDATLETDEEAFVFQVQGRYAFDVLGTLTDADLRAIDFYAFEEVELAGRPVRVFGHGMSPEAGVELHGAPEDKAAVKAAILEAGEAYDIRALGSRAYLSNSVRLGWLPGWHVPPIFESEALAEYRAWRRLDRPSGNYSIGGSFDSDDITDYYREPIELGYGKLVHLDHDFVGRDAVSERAAEPRRTKVAFEWAEEDVRRITGSLYGSGTPYKQFRNLPRAAWAYGHFDEVRRDGELVGLSNAQSYEWDVRTVMSLGLVEPAHSDPGTELTIVWGEPGGTSPNPVVEDHVQTEVAVTVREVPYTARDDRKAR